MKKTLPLLLLSFVGSPVAHAVVSSTNGSTNSSTNSSTNTLSPPNVHTQEALIQKDAAKGDDSYTPLITNYYSCMIDFPLDFLVNLDNGKPPLPVEKFSLACLAHSPNIAFTYGMRIHTSRFAICPGIGCSSLKYSFKGHKSGEEMIFPALKRVKKDDTECSDIDPAADLHVADTEAKAKVSSSTFSVSYFDILLRLRFNSVLDEPKDGFYVWLGGKLGIRIDASSSITFSKYDESSVLSSTEYYNLRRYVWGVQLGMGYHRFGLTAGYSFNSLFEDGQGPSGTNRIRPLSIGVQLDLF
ncbi:outer membrane beta-barrel protein [Candidatus Cardinium hertigii]|uniref:PorT family protein n=1 Tax=Candidatus Cardinium hertigii TaxID=247481 RepID=A0A3N2QBX1_9BACT|nr:outer membrane beta-barrel protein [Candidatus Cardinium hertigii]ROT47316.1 PorT family protein [Candidatus Cardinium hertigii]